jgi:hypothetical protein
MAENINLQQLLMSAGSKVGKGVMGNESLQKGTDATMNYLSQLLDFAQQTNAMPQAQTQAPQMALDEGAKVLKKFYKQSAEELVHQPGGDEILRQQIEAAQPSQAQIDSTTLKQMDRNPSAMNRIRPGQQPAQPSPTGTAQPTTQQPTQGTDMLKQLMGGASGGLKGAISGFAEGFAWGVNPEMMKNKLESKKLVEDTRQFDETLEVRKQELAQKVSAGESTANLETAKLQIRQAELFKDWFKAMGEYLDGDVLGIGKPSIEKIRKEMTNVLGEKLGDLRSGTSENGGSQNAGNKKVDRKAAKAAGWTDAEIDAYEKKQK